MEEIILFTSTAKKWDPFEEGEDNHYIEKF